MKLAVLALVLLGACAPEAGPLLLAYEGSSEGHRAAELAVAEWVDTCHVDVRLDPTGIPLVETDEGLSERAAGRTDWLDETETTYWIRFRPNRGLEKTRATIAHEIGHALGLDHVAEREDIMFKQSAGKHVRPEDCAALP